MTLPQKFYGLRPTLSVVLHEILWRHNGVVGKAKKEIVARLIEDPELLDQIVEAELHYCAQAFKSIKTEGRAA